MHSENEVVYLHLDDIIPNRFQPREVFDDHALKELAISIKEHGVIQPIIVRNIGNKYEIIAGERRYKASALAGLTKIPAIIRNLDDKESSKVALLENLQRRDLNPIEEARTYQKILELDQMTQEELAKTMGKSQSAVANKLRLLSLSEEVQQALLKEQISERHARTLLNLTNPEEQKQMLKQVIQSRMTVRELEQEIQKEKIKKEELIPRKDSDKVEEQVLPKTEIPDNNIQLGSNISSPLVEEKPKLMDNIDGNPNYMQTDIFASSTPLEQPSSKIDSQPKFINYGEIDPDEDEEDSSPEKSFPFAPSSAGTPIDINALKSSTKDINEPEKKIADLDSLLNITPDSIPKQDDLSKMKQNENSTSAKNLEPFSKRERFAPEGINSFFGNTPENNLISSTNTKEEQARKISIKEAINMVRDNIKDLQQHGIEVDIDEINFENSYQIVIKINKNN